MPEEYVSRSSGSERGRRAGHEKAKDEGEPSAANASEVKHEREAREQQSRKREEIERRREEVRKNREKKFGKEKTPPISFKDAKKKMDVIAAIQDEKKVVVSPKELKDFKDLLVEHGGFDAKSVENMSVGEILAMAQEVYKQAGVADPEETDLREHKSSKRKNEERLLKLLKNNVLSADEEVLTPKKIDANLEVSDTDELMDIGEGAGVGTMAATNWYENLPDPANVTSPELAKVIRSIRRIGISGDGELERLKRMQDQLDDVDEAVDPTNVENVTNILSGRLRVLREETQQLRLAELERSRETPPADELLEITKSTRNIIDKLMGEAEGTVEWGTDKAQLEEKLARAEEVVRRVVAPSTEAERMQTGEVIAITGGERIRTYRYVFEVTRAIRQASESYISPEDKAKLALIVGDTDRLNSYVSRKRSESLLRILDGHFLKIYEDKTLNQQDEAVGDINEKAHHYYNAALSGWRDLDEATRIVLSLVDRKEDNDGLREWKATNGFQSIIDAVKIHQMTAPPHDWHDVPKVLSNIFNEIEDTQVSPDDLGAVAQKARQIIANIPQYTEEGRELRIKLSDRLEAFKAWHVMVMSLDKKDMNPEGVINGISEYFEGREESTLEDFLERFGADNRGREFYVTLDENGNQLRDEHNNPLENERVNLFDPEYALINETLQTERIKSNVIEAMTRHAIENPFDNRTLRQIQEWAGLLNPDGTINEFFGWKEGRTNAQAIQFFNAEVEKLRIYFKDKMQANINATGELNGLSVDDVWGRTRKFTIVGREKSGINITNEIVDAWHTHRTLHGAFGTVTKGDLEELAEEFGMAFNNDENSTEWHAVSERFLGESFLQVRRDHLKEQMIEQLKRQGLKVNRNFTDHDGIDLRDADFDELSESGFFGSVEYNVYQWAWIKLWGNLDTIRIYSRDSKSKLDDDYESVVFHHSTNLFYDRMVAHTWEFYHEGNETRGRPLENDTNRIVKQFLPGKHHYVFPQNIASVRWADKFMSDAQRRFVEDRVKHLMEAYDSDVVAWHKQSIDWMRNSVIMDMIENGQFSFTHKDSATGRRVKFTDIVKNKGIGKFEMIDLFTDRNKHVKYMGPDGLQDYLANPSNSKFAELADKTKTYYSTRDARLFTFMVFALRFHWELMNKHNKRLFDRIDMQSAAMENFVETLTAAGVVEKETAVDFKRQNLGFVEFSPRGNQDDLDGTQNDTLAVALGFSGMRRVRQALELMRLSGWENKYSLGGILGVFWAMVTEFVKKLPDQLNERR